jgi:hypothetical protein
MHGYDLVAAPTRTAAATVAAAPVSTATAGAPAIAAATLLAAVAIRAVNGPIATGLERHLGVFATLGANRRVHLAFAAVAAAVAAAALARSLAGSAAVGAATGGGEPLGLIEFLFTVRERELLSAVRASKVLVRHVSLANSC